MGEARGEENPAIRGAADESQADPAVVTRSQRKAPGAALHEYFTLSEARALAHETPPIVREQLARVATLARQQHRAAESLWSSGHRAEGLKLLESALHSANELVRQLGEEVGDRPRVKASQNTLRLVASDAPMDPNFLDERVKAEDEVRYELMERSFRQAMAPVEPFYRQEGEVRWMQLRRLLSAVALVVVLVAAVFFLTYQPAGVFASATDQQGEWPAEFAVDANPETEWQGNNGQRPRLDVRIHPPRNIARVRVLNGHNRHYNDRAVRAYEMIFFRNGEEVERIEDTFSELTPTPDWVEHPVDGSEIDRVQFVVRSYFQSGSALAELEFLEQ